MSAIHKTLKDMNNSLQDIAQVLDNTEPPLRSEEERLKALNADFDK